MAILPDLPGVEVTIQMDGVAMKEYDDVDEVDTNGDELKQYQASKTVSKYIECLNDKEFSIAVSSSLHFSPLAFTTGICITGNMTSRIAQPYRKFEQLLALRSA